MSRYNRRDSQREVKDVLSAHDSVYGQLSRLLSFIAAVSNSIQYLKFLITRSHNPTLVHDRNISKIKQKSPVKFGVFQKYKKKSIIIFSSLIGEKFIIQRSTETSIDYVEDISRSEEQIR